MKTIVFALALLGLTGAGAMAGQGCPGHKSQQSAEAPPPPPPPAPSA